MKILAEFIIAHRTKLLWSISVFVVISGAMITKNELNDKFVEYFDKSVKFRRDTDHVTEKPNRPVLH